MTSSTSGIEVSAELKSAFNSARLSGNTAFIKVSIVDDKLQGVHTERKSGQGWSRDFDGVARQLEADRPAFVLFFKSRDEVILITYAPDSATVKDKMSYSSSKAALNTLVNARQFGASGASSGNSKGVEQYFAENKKDISYSAYQAHTKTEYHGLRSEVEEALAELPKTIDKKEFGKSMGYSLLANVSGKPLPPQLANYASGGSSGNSNQFRGGSHNFHAKPSAAKAANGGHKLPGWNSPTAQAMNGGASPSPTNSSSSSSSYSAARSSPTGGSSNPAAAYKAAVAAASSPTNAGASSSPSSSPTSGSGSGGFGDQPRMTGTCVKAGCGKTRVRNGYCADCLNARLTGQD